MIDWKEKAERILSDWKNADFNYEIVRKHIDLGSQLEITDKELEALTCMIDTCAHWKSLARKLLKSRELSKLEHQIPLN